MRLPTPNDVFRGLRNQVGSVRKRYLSGNTLVRHDDFDGKLEVVVLIHGFFQTRNIWDVMEDRLRYDGYAVASFNMGGLLSPTDLKPVDHLAQLVGHKLERLQQRHNLGGLHILGHARGGIIGRRYIESFGGAATAKSLITLGSPHRGTLRATLGSLMRRVEGERFPATVPMTSVFSTDDWITPPFRCRIKPLSAKHQMHNAEVRGVGHSELVWDPGVYRIVREKLAEATAMWEPR